MFNFYTMESMQSIAEKMTTNDIRRVCEDAAYDELIQKLQEAKANQVPIDEGLFTAILGGIAGVTFGPAVMKCVCKVLGINEKGSLGSLMTSKLVLGALATEIGWKA